MRAYIFLTIILNIFKVAVYCLPFDNLLPFDAEQESCLQELNLDRIKMGLLNAQLFPTEDDHEYNEFFSCTWKKQGFQNNLGEINYKKLETFFSEFLLYQINNDRSFSDLAQRMAESAMKSCINVNGNSHGQKAVRLQNCIFYKLENYNR